MGIPPFSGPPGPSLLSPKGFNPNCLIQGFGDSISAASTYQQYPLPYANIPIWVASTAYIVGNTVTNGGFLYQCTVAGTSAGSGGPTGTSSAITDNTATWAWQTATANKSGYSYLTWTEIFSDGLLVWDMSTGRGGIKTGLYHVYVVNGGSNYAPSDTVSFPAGATGTLTIVGGVITACTIISPGQSFNYFTPTINTSTGSGAILSPATGGTGTFGTPGGKTFDMVAALPEVVASRAGIIIFLGGTNDLVNDYTFETITGNLRTCYETLLAAGKRVVAVPILPRGVGSTVLQNTMRQRVNAWIRGYVLQLQAANPNQIPSIVLADPSGYWTDGTYSTETSGFDYPVGGVGGVIYSVTQDGLHPNNRGAMALGYVLWEAIKPWFQNSATKKQRNYSEFNGQDVNSAPAGNMVEAMIWQPSTAYVIRQRVTNGGKIYRCTVAGTSASSGGPTGSGTGIVDGSVTWNYYDVAGRSISMGTAGTFSAMTNITSSGQLPSGWTVNRNAGSATGTIIGTIENPWSDGTFGQRATLAVNLGTGTSAERFSINFNGTNKSVINLGFTAADIGTAYLYGEIEVELSAVKNMCQLKYILSDLSNSLTQMVVGAQTGGVGNHIPDSYGDCIPMPQKFYLRTPSFLMSASQYLPTALTNMDITLTFEFDTSAAPASAVIKVNQFTVKRDYTL